MKRAIGIAVVCLFLVIPASADLTQVYQTSWGPISGYVEKDLAPGLPEFTSNPGGDEPVNGVDDYKPGDVLSQFYMSWTRVDDDQDQFWWDLNGGMSVKAIYTSSPLYLVYSTNEGTGTGAVAPPGSGGGNLDTVGETGSIDIVPNSDAFIWGAAGSGATKWSNEALNGGTDRMVTYCINKFLDGTSPTVPTFVLGFEDGTDYDYQDFVVEVSNVVPVPGAVLLGLLGLSTAGVRIRRRRA
jgi:hypothetical protein